MTQWELREQLPADLTPEEFINRCRNAPRASDDKGLVDRMAETMCDTFNAYNAWDSYSNDDKEEWREAARAVIKMLEAEHEQA